MNDEQKVFVNVYIELLQLKENKILSTSAYVDSAQNIFHRYQFTKKEYEKQLGFFHEKPERWEAFYKEIDKRLKEPSSPNPF